MMKEVRGTFAVNEQLEALPETEAEPKPWTVSVWRFLSETREPFLTREDAIEFAFAMDDQDCSVDGVYRPDGTLDTDAEREWR